MQMLTPPEMASVLSSPTWLESEQSTQPAGFPFSSTLSPCIPAGQTHGVLGSSSWSYCGSFRLHDAQSVRCSPSSAPCGAIASSPAWHWTHGVAGSVSVSACPGAQFSHPSLPTLPCGLYWPDSQLRHSVWGAGNHVGQSRSCCDVQNALRGTYIWVRVSIRFPWGADGALLR